MLLVLVKLGEANMDFVAIIEIAHNLKMLESSLKEARLKLISIADENAKSKFASDLRKISDKLEVES